jgi:hypothetical protein
MTNKRLLTVLAMAFISLMIISCKKDNGTPTIKFVPGPGFTGKDTIIKVNQTLLVALQINWNGTDSLQTLDIQQNGVSAQQFPIAGDKISTRLEIIKGTDATEKWTFVAIDVKGNQSSVTLTLTKDPNSEVGAIFYYASVVLGAQNNTTRPGFISFQTQPATTYTLEGAFINQAKIDLLYYSDATTFSTLSSPGADIPANLYPGARSISGWTTKNVDGFIKTTMSVQDFTSMVTDASIISAWSDSKSVSKAGSLKADEIWLVKMQSGKKGAVHVKRIVAGDGGEIEFAIKIQQ